MPAHNVTNEFVIAFVTLAANNLLHTFCDTEDFLSDKTINVDLLFCTIWTDAMRFPLRLLT